MHSPTLTDPVVYTERCHLAVTNLHIIFIFQMMHFCPKEIENMPPQFVAINFTDKKSYFCIMFMMFTGKYLLPAILLGV